MPTIDKWLPQLIKTIDIPEVEIHAVFPQSERAIRLFIYRKIRMAYWEDLARLLNSDTE